MVATGSMSVMTQGEVTHGHQIQRSSWNTKVALLLTSIAAVGFFSLLTLWGQYCSLFLKYFYLFIFRERGREEERQGEKHQCVVASCTPPSGCLA